MSRDTWIKAKEILESELEREPTSEEIDEKCIDLEAAMIDEFMK